MTREEIYLDNAATTRPDPAVVAAMLETLTSGYGNPSSLHGKGVRAERLVTQAREQVREALGAGDATVVFTSGGTEANNLAVVGAARAYEGRARHLVTTAVEHSSVLGSAHSLTERGFEVTVLPVDANGEVDPTEVRRALRPDTVLVSVMAVNNEVGTVQPVREIARLLADVRGAGRLPLLHVDGVQAFGRVPLPVAGVDLLTVSAHKIHGPKVVGALILRPRVRIAPLLIGGEQERALRPGTENVPGIVGLGAAAALAAQRAAETTQHLRMLRARFLAHLADLPGVTVNGAPGDSAPHILNLHVNGVRGEVLVHRLEQEGVYISTGSACHSRNPRPSHVLLAIGLGADAALECVRVSFARTTTADDVDAAALAVHRAVAELRVLAS